MGFWRTAANMGRAGGRIVTSTVRGGGKLLSVGGSAIKTATVGAGVGYIGWQTLVKDKPLARTVADMAVGHDNVQSVSDTVGNAVDGVAEMTHRASDALAGVNNAFSGGSGAGAFAGMGNFMQGLCSGNGLGMIGDFFRNIGNGNVSGLSLAGLIGAGILIFGRFGWLGKIIGALLGMMIIGGNVNMARVMGAEPAQPLQNSQGQAAQTGLVRTDDMASARPEGNPVVHRTR